MSAPQQLSVSLWRGGKDGRYETYTVPRRESQTVLDVVTAVCAAASRRGFTVTKVILIPFCRIPFIWRNRRRAYRAAAVFRTAPQRR